MFTGLVQDLGEVLAVDADGGGARLRVRTILAGELAEGDSIAVNGVCLTATQVTADGFAADAMHESLRRTSLAGVVQVFSVNPPRHPSVSFLADRFCQLLGEGRRDGLGYC